MAKGERLAPYSDFELIDNIVRSSAGAYTHDAVFELSLNFVLKITLLHYEQEMFKQRYQAIEREINK